MSDVVDRITARLDEMEAVAKEAAESRGSDAEHWTAVEDGDGWAIEAAPDLCVTCNDSGGNELTAEVAAHIALNDPAAVLAAVAGLRAVVALHVAPSAGMPGGVYDPECNHEGYGLPSPDECETLRIIAAMWPDTDPRQVL